jgi:nucleoside 2-deoxyribosyltransferase
MAFDRPDTDRLYERGILPVLKRNSVTPVIVNRRQSNMDLNVQIVNELLSSDFCIADLTYARPSVYFEAGFAERSIPVIYTVRRDHLHKNQPEELRVHFDLQMKPLITWKDPDDSSFPDRLEKRLKATVLKSWRRKVEAAAAEAARIDEFSRLSLAQRLSTARRACMSALHRAGFRSWHAPVWHYRSQDLAYIASGYVNGVYSRRTVEGSLHLATIHAFESMTKTELNKLREAFSPINLLSRQMDLQLDRPKGLVLNHFVVALRPATPTRIESVFTSLNPVKRPQLYLSPATSIPRSLNANRPSVPFSQSWHFISPVHSEDALTTELNSIVADYIGQRAA